MPIENFKNFEAPELKLLDTGSTKVTCMVVWSVLVGRCILGELLAYYGRLGQLQTQKILLSGIEIFLMGECNGIATGRYLK